jgi:DNA polymerase III subunit beta
MNVTCQQEQLARGLSLVGRAVATRSTLPVLANILMATDDSRLRLSATNLEVGITYWMPVQVDSPGAITVPARLLSDFVNSLPASQVVMTLDERTQTLRLSADRYDAEVKGIDAADFPVLPTVEQGLRFSLDTSGLREMISRVTVAAASDESRPILTGILTQLDPDAGLMTLAAADGFRLSVFRDEFHAPLPGPISIIVPARALVELARVVSDEDTEVDVAITDTLSQILFRTRNVDLVSQLISGSFPDYEKIMPSHHTIRMVTNTKALHGAVRMASFFARDAANVVRLELRPGTEDGPGTVQVSAQAAEVGANHGEVEAAIDGGPLEIAFNAKYLLDILAVIGTDQVTVELSTASSPGVFRAVDDQAFTHVIMPMHIGR